MGDRVFFIFARPGLSVRELLLEKFSQSRSCLFTSLALKVTRARSSQRFQNTAYTSPSSSSENATIPTIMMPDLLPEINIIMSKLT